MRTACKIAIFQWTSFEQMQSWTLTTMSWFPRMYWTLLSGEKTLSKPASHITLQNTHFRIWQDNPTNILGFMRRKIGLDSQGRFEYSSVFRDSSDGTCHYNFILGAAIFYHRFYHYVSNVKNIHWNLAEVWRGLLQQYTYIQPQEVRAKVDELFNCEDIFLNAMIGDLTTRPGIIMKLPKGSPQVQCDDSSLGALHLKLK